MKVGSMIRKYGDIMKHRFIALFLMLAVTLIPLSAAFTPKKAEALFNLGPDTTFVIGGNGTVQESLSAAANQLTAGIQQTLQQKELTLDGIAYALAKRAIKQMTGNIVNWINSGFQGSPMFITDLNGFLMDIADQVAGEFIYGSGLAFLCSPFSLQVRGALEIQYQQSKSASSGSQCTFTGVIENIKNFGTSFTNWQDWFEITTSPQNNQYGALLAAQASLDISIRNAQGQEVKLLEFGNGFLSMKQCTDVAGGGKDCKVVTPGAVIEEQLNQHLGSGLQSLIEADEINEIINALFAQLAEQAVTGLNGLLGLSGGGAGGSGSVGNSYLNQMANETGGSVGLTYNTENPIATSLKLEQDLIKVHQEIAEKIAATETKATAKCTALTATLLTARTDAQTEITSGTIIITTLTRLNAEFNAASTATAKNNVYFDYLDLESAGYLSSNVDLSNTKVKRDQIVLEIAAFENELKDECE